MENEELSQTGPDVQHKNSVLAVAVLSQFSKGQARPDSTLFLKTNWLCRELKIYNGIYPDSGTRALSITVGGKKRQKRKAA